MAASYQLSLSRRKATLLAVAWLLIMVGLSLVDGALDRGTNSGIGGMLFGAGWLLVALTVAMERHSYKPQWDRFLERSIPALLILAAAVLAQRAMQHSARRFMLTGLLFALAWAYFALVNSYDDGWFKGFNPKKAGLLFGGAALIVVGMGVLMMNRRYSFMTQSLTGPGNVYNLGMPAFVVGWILVLVGLSQR